MSVSIATIGQVYEPCRFTQKVTYEQNTNNYIFERWELIK